jgi:methyl acetate hydrolase
MTAGLGSVNRSPDLLKWAQSENLNTRYLGPHTTEKSYLYPLLFNPGSAWVYGVGLDWAGILISRVTGKSLEDHFREAIFEKAGMRDTTFYPTEEVKRRLMRMTTQESREAPIKACSENFSGLGSLNRTSDPDKVGVMSGGAGLFSTAKDYLAFLRGILASQSDTDSKALLSPSSFEELFKDAFRPETDDEHFLFTLKSHELHDPALSTREGASGKDRKIVQSVGLAVNLVDSANGRKAGSGCWDGAARTMYWMDPKTGLAVSRAPLCEVGRWSRK